MMLMIKGSTLPHLIQVTDLDLLAMFKVLVPNFITVITWLFLCRKGATSLCFLNVYTVTSSPYK